MDLRFGHRSKAPAAWTPALLPAYRPLPSSVLIVKLAAIGDIAMALPMVTALRTQFPKVRIAWLCGQLAEPLLRCVEGIDEILTVDETALFGGSRVRKARAVLATWSKLRGRRFDLVLLAHADRRYRLIVGPFRGGELRWLGATSPRAAMVPGRYHGDEYVRLVTGVDDGRARRFAVPSLATTLDAGIGDRLAACGARPLIALAPGGAKNLARESPLRRWPLDSYAALARGLRANGYAVALTGSETDEWVRPAFADVDIVDLIGATTLPGLVALYRGCAAVVTHDSGPLHLARLADAHVVGLFGPTTPASRTLHDAHGVMLWPGAVLPCAPCYDGRDFARCSNNRCMQLITVEAVLQRTMALAAP